MLASKSSDSSTRSRGTGFAEKRRESAEGMRLSSNGSARGGSSTAGTSDRHGELLPPLPPPSSLSSRPLEDLQKDGSPGEGTGEDSGEAARLLERLFDTAVWWSGDKEHEGPIFTLSKSSFSTATLFSLHSGGFGSRRWTTGPDEGENQWLAAAGEAHGEPERCAMWLSACATTCCSSAGDRLAIC